MKKVETNDTLKKMGDLFLQKKTADGSMHGCTFLLPPKEYKMFLQMVGSKDGKVRFMGVPVLKGKGKQVVMTDALVQNEEASFSIEEHARKIVQETHDKLTEMLRESLEREGHTFKTNAKMFQFVRERKVKIDTRKEGKKTFQFVMLGDKELFSYEVTEDRHDRNDTDEE